METNLLQILGTIVTARTPLCTDEMEVLLGCEPGNVSLTLHRLQSIITDPSKPRICFLYPSLLVFLTDCTRSGKFFIDTAAHHGNLARCCMRIIAKGRLDFGYAPCLFL